MRRLIAWAAETDDQTTDRAPPETAAAGRDGASGSEARESEPAPRLATWAMLSLRGLGRQSPGLRLAASAGVE